MNTLEEDRINKLEEDRIMLSSALTDLQLAYNAHLIDLRKAKWLLKTAFEDIPEIKTWRYANEALALIEKEEE